MATAASYRSLVPNEAAATIFSLIISRDVEWECINTDP